MNPITKLTSCISQFSSQSTMELLQERIRYQLEQCDALFTVGVEDRGSGVSFNSSLASLASVARSSLYTACNGEPCLVACCLDSLLAL